MKRKLTPRYFKVSFYKLSSLRFSNQFVFILHTGYIDAYDRTLLGKWGHSIKLDLRTFLLEPASWYSVYIS